MYAVLNPEMVTAVLNYLDIKPTNPDSKLLDQLINAYIRKVPWESAFRIARRARITNTNKCPRWPAIFWQEALTLGGGGTCFESNYAFLTLLKAVGFEGYLTINNMGDSIGCHTAIIILLDGQKWLVDAGLPIHAPLPLSHRGRMYRATRFMNYCVWPDGEQRYQVERWPHPQHNAFTLIDKPVTETAYRAATTADYEPTGHFLDRVVVNKIVGERPFRFNSADQPYRFESFHDGQRSDHWIEEDVATAVASKFSMDVHTLRAAFDALAKPQKEL